MSFSARKSLPADLIVDFKDLINTQRSKHTIIALSKWGICFVGLSNPDFVPTLPVYGLNIDRCIKPYRTYEKVQKV